MKLFTFCQINHRNVTIFIIFFSFVVIAKANIYYVDQNSIGGSASDLNPGTITSPWLTLTKGISSALPGDTVFFRQGIYRLDGNNIIGYPPLSIPTNATANARITYKGYANEQVVFTAYNVIQNNPTLWTQVSGNIYSSNLGPSTYGYDLTSIDGKVLLRMPGRFSQGNITDLTGPGQFAVSGSTIYVWAFDGSNPGTHQTEISRRNDVIRLTSDYVTFENLTVEGGYYPYATSANYAIVKNCTFRNYDGHVKVLGWTAPNCSGGGTGGEPWNSLYGVIEGCNFYNFMNMGIDCTGGDFWILRGNNIHHPVNGYAGPGIMVKNNSIGVIVENNIIHDIGFPGIAYPGITIGGQSCGGNVPNEGENIIVRNNLFYNLTGEKIVTFMGALNCGFYNNIIHNCTASEGLIALYNSNSGSVPNSAPNVRNPVIKNNIAYSNQVASNRFLTEWIPNSSENVISDYNLVNPNLVYNLGGITRNLNDWQAFGQDVHSITSQPQYVDVANNNFNTVSNSPVINSGQNLPGIVDFDYNAVTRPQSNATDIGPFEFVGVLAVDDPNMTGYWAKDDNFDYIKIHCELFNENQNCKFLLHRSIDGISFTHIANLTNNSTTHNDLELECNDRDVNTGVDYYYRLSQIDDKGSQIFFDIIKVSKLIENDISIYPNPNSGFLSIDFSNDIIDEIVLSNQMGKIVVSNKLSAKNEPIDLTNLSEGLYFYYLQKDGLNIKSGKLVICNTTH